MREEEQKITFNYSNRTYIYPNRLRIVDNIMKLLLQSSMCRETQDTFLLFGNSTGTAETSRSSITLSPLNYPNRIYIAISTLIEHTHPLYQQSIFNQSISLSTSLSTSLE